MQGNMVKYKSMRRYKCSPPNITQYLLEAIGNTYWTQLYEKRGYYEFTRSTSEN